MLVTVLDKFLNAEKDVDMPALHNGTNFGVGSFTKAKVGKAAKAETYHALFIPEAEVAVFM